MSLQFDLCPMGSELVLRLVAFRQRVLRLEGAIPDLPQELAPQRT